MSRAIGTAGLSAAPGVVPASGTTYYVAPSGNDGNSCLATSSLCATIGGAINKASNGDTISIAGGTYYNTNLSIGKSLTLSGAGVGQTIIDGQNSGRMIYVSSGVTVLIQGITIQHGRASVEGSGIINSGALTLRNSAVINNSTVGANGGNDTASSSNGSYGGDASNHGCVTYGSDNGGPGGPGNSPSLTGYAGGNVYGGGIYNGGGTVVLDHATLSGNTAVGGNGGSGGNGGNGGAGYGGGIENSGSNGRLTVNTSTLAANIAKDGAVGGYGGQGTGSGGGAEGSGGSGNSGRTHGGGSGGPGAAGSNGGAGSRSGGAIYNDATVQLTFATLAYNHAQDPNGADNGTGGGLANNGSATVTASILGDNAAATGPDCYNSSSFTSGGYNVVLNESGCNFGSLPTDPQLGPLQNNGGPTLTIAPQSGSAAIQLVPSSACTGFTTDQRDDPRPDQPGRNCDAGAVQLQTLFYVSTSGADNSTCGPAATPCQTIGHAISLAPSSGTIRIAAGTYTENLSFGKALTLQGAGANQTIIDGGQNGSVLTLNSGAGGSTVSGLTIRNGKSNNSGGGVYNPSNTSLTLANSIISGNGADHGGSIGNDSTLLITATTVSTNTATFGGGVDNRGALTVVNSTLSGNSAPSNGGALDNEGGATALYNATIARNAVTQANGKGGGVALGGGTVALSDTIVASNTAPAEANGPDCFGALTSGGYNLIGDGTGCTGPANGANGDQVGTGAAPIDARLGPLQDNGGAGTDTGTHADHGAPRPTHQRHRALQPGHRRRQPQRLWRSWRCQPDGRPARLPAAVPDGRTL